MLESDTAKELDQNFRTFIIPLLKKRKGKKGCLIFDDLMKHFEQTSFMCDLFTKMSSHENLTVIYITQNIFSCARGQGDNVTVYRNTHVLVLFPNYLDNSPINIIASRISMEGEKNTKKIKEMLLKIQKEFRYVVLRGDFNTPAKLRISSDYFNHLSDEVPYLFQVFPLEP